MAIMTVERVRHLPVMDDGNLVGLISIGDLSSIIEDRDSLSVNSQITSQEPR